jgi:NAD(P)H-dependent flavin oxidoreductase YrpB (nitropropane dioxygenase family)
MANAFRGTVPLQVGEQTYLLSFSVNALCELEEQMDQPIAKIAKTLGKPEDMRMSTVRALVWAALRDNHPETDLKAAGLLISEAGVPVVMPAIGKAFQLAFPVPSGAKESPRPQPAKD